MSCALRVNVVKPGIDHLLGWWNPGFTALGGARTARGRADRSGACGRVKRGR